MVEKAIIEADAKEVADKIIAAARDADNEADLEVNTEHILKTVLDKLGIANYASYEFRTGKGTLVVGTGLIDALYGRVVIEYESPGTFDNPAGFNHAKEQVIGYIQQLAPSAEAWQKYFGVVLDGYQIGFVRFRKNWVSDGPYPINERTILTFLEALRGLRRLALKVESLNKHLGAGSPVAETLVKVLYETLIKNKEHKRVKVLFNDWKRVFGQVCGYSSEKIKGLEQAYGLSANEIDYEGLLFAVHTYYALVMKLLAAEVAVASGDSYLQSYLKKFETAYYHGHEELRSMLRDVEEGDIFARAIGIKNFLEDDYFGWYLDVWDEHMGEVVSTLASMLSKFEPATLEHEPEEVKDLLKRLYQYLVPKRIRHDLGEYYTPDWLAELVISEVGYDGNLEKRFLDPACGSGTFLVLAIKRARQYALDNFRNETETLEAILKNIVGFDLNPLAVLAARTNYLIALGKLLKYKRGDIELPVYFADSILVDRKPTLYGTYAYSLKTEADEFQIPTGVVRKGLLPKVLAVLEECVQTTGCSEEIFEERVKREASSAGAALNKNELSILDGLFHQLKYLEGEDRNRIWTRILKNSFAPLLQDKFDYVVGNPPWVNWESLPENYRNGTKDPWEDYKLFTLSGMEARLGGGKKDISILFAYRCLDRYLKERGNFGFLITQSVFKTKGAGEGFRRFKIAERKEREIKEVPVTVVKVHDLVELNPFEGASNRTAAIFIKKKGETNYPVKYEYWKRKKKQRIDQKDSLEAASEKSYRIELCAYPSDEENILSPWLTLPENVINAVKKVQGKGYYRAYAGIYSGGANAVYWLNILGIASRRDEKMDIPTYLRNILGIQEAVPQINHKSRPST
jgi:SAM-dependent methyltransferase